MEYEDFWDEELLLKDILRVDIRGAEEEPSSCYYYGVLFI